MGSDHSAQRTVVSQLAMSPVGRCDRGFILWHAKYRKRPRRILL